MRKYQGQYLILIKYKIRLTEEGFLEWQNEGLSNHLPSNYDKFGQNCQKLPEMVVFSRTLEILPGHTTN